MAAGGIGSWGADHLSACDTSAGLVMGGWLSDAGGEQLSRGVRGVVVCVLEPGDCGEGAVYSLCCGLEAM